MTRDPISPEELNPGLDPEMQPTTQQAATSVLAGHADDNGINTSPEDCTSWPTHGAENDRLLALLQRGELRLTGLMPWSSNYTFLGQVSDCGHAVRYKGEIAALSIALSHSWLKAAFPLRRKIDAPTRGLWFRGSHGY